MTAATAPMPLTLDAITARRARSQAELAELQRELAGIPAELDRLDEQVAVGSQEASQEAIRTQAELRIRARQLPHWIAQYETAVQQDLATEQQLRVAALRERERQEKAAVQKAVDDSWIDDYVAGLVACARGAGKYRRRLERFAEVHSGGDRERERQLILNRSGAGNLTLALEAVAGWLRVNPAVNIAPDLARLDQLSGGEGETLRAVRDAFFGKE